MIHTRSRTLAAAGLIFAMALTGCAAEADRPAADNASTPSTAPVTPRSVSVSSSAAPTYSRAAVPDSQEGDDFGVVVGGVRYIVEKSFYKDEITVNLGSDNYPAWQSVEAESGSRFLVVDGVVANESKGSIYPYAPIEFAVQAEATDGSMYGMDQDSHAADERGVPMLHTLAPHYEMEVRYVYTVPSFLDIEHMAVAPFGRYTPDQLKRIKIDP